MRVNRQGVWFSKDDWRLAYFALSSLKYQPLPPEMWTLSLKGRLQAGDPVQLVTREIMWSLKVFFKPHWGLHWFDSLGRFEPFIVKSCGSKGDTVAELRYCFFIHPTDHLNCVRFSSCWIKVIFFLFMAFFSRLITSDTSWSFFMKSSLLKCSV